MCFALLVAVGLAAWRLIPRHTVSFDDQSNSVSLRGEASDNSTPVQSLETVPSARPGRVVYPYSVVPGGVQDPADLQRASAQDRVVSNHFVGFNYQRAHVVRLQQAKEVYLSYRIGDRVFWTRKKVRLKAGEKLISDGKITARTRCANRVSDSKQGNVSPQEPLLEKFEHPTDGDGTAQQFHFPSAFDSALLGHPQMPDPGHLIPSAQAPFAPFGARYVPGIAPPPFPTGACETLAQENGEGSSDNEKTESHCPLVPTPTPPPATVPEPGTLLLVSSGIAGLYLKYRNKSRTTV